MEEDWSIVKNDCLLFSGVDTIMGMDDSFHLHSSSFPLLQTSDPVKLELDDSSDYHGSSSSNSPSSLSDSLGVPDYSPLCLPHSVAPSLMHSPTSLGMPLSSMVSLHSPSSLPPVSNFSHMTFPQSEREHVLMKTQSEITRESCGGSCSPCDSSRSLSPLNPSMDSLYNNHRIQVRTRSKMHEMALQHRLITDQDPRGSGTVQLSAEERRTLMQEGYSVPNKLPLSKADEEALRIVRRKIKNKLSAQESRRKRKEYIDTLEQRCQMFAMENSQLKSRVKQLENQMRKCGGVRI